MFPSFRVSVGSWSPGHPQPRVWDHYLAFVVRHGVVKATLRLVSSRSLTWSWGPPGPGPRSHEHTRHAESFRTISVLGDASRKGLAQSLGHTVLWFNCSVTL